MSQEHFEGMSSEVKGQDRCDLLNNTRIHTLIIKRNSNKCLLSNSRHFISKRSPWDHFLPVRPWLSISHWLSLKRWTETATSQMHRGIQSRGGNSGAWSLFKNECLHYLQHQVVRSFSFPFLPCWNNSWARDRFKLLDNLIVASHDLKKVSATSEQKDRSAE